MNYTKFAITAPFTLLNFFLSALVFSCLWKWFIVPLGIMELTYVHAMGFMLVWDYLAYNKSLNRFLSDHSVTSDTLPELAISYIVETATILFSAGLGASIHLLMLDLK